MASTMHVACIPLPSDQPISVAEWEEKRARLEEFARELFAPSSEQQVQSKMSKMKISDKESEGAADSAVPQSKATTANKATLNLFARWQPKPQDTAEKKKKKAGDSEKPEDEVPIVHLNAQSEVLEDRTSAYPKSYHIRLGKSPIHGRGVFATKSFVPREIVEVCPTIEVSSSNIGGLLEDYVYYGEQPDVRVVVMGYGMMYNSWRNANLWYYRDTDNNFVFVADRAIEEGEELMIDYGEDWWSSRDTKVGLGYDKPAGESDTKSPREVDVQVPSPMSEA
eukprot:RCo031206